MEKIHPWAIPALILAAVIGGLAPIITKFALKEFYPLTILVARCLFAFLTFLPILILKNKLKIATEDIKKIIFTGLLFSGNIIFFLFGVQFTTAVVSQLLYLLVPIMTICLSFIFLKQKTLFIQILGSLIGFSGAFLIIRTSLTTQELINSLGTFRGNLIILLGVCSWSGYLVYSKPLTKKYSALTLTAYANLTAFFLCLPFFIKQLNNQQIIKTTPSFIGLMSLLAIVLLISVIMMFLYQWGNKHTSPFIVGSSQYLSPFIAALAGGLLLGEKLSLMLVLSAILIFVGLYLSIIQPILAKSRLTGPRRSN